MCKEQKACYEAKRKAIETVLGEMDKPVGHAIIAFEAGGAIDMHYYSNHIQGTGFATMELIGHDTKYSKPNMLGHYEFLGFTRHSKIYQGNVNDYYKKIERRFCKIFTELADYSSQTVLNPKDTIEASVSEDEIAYLILDKYDDFKVLEEKHHLLLVVEVFKSEIEYAIQNGVDKLIEKLKHSKVYPYSDLDRKVVI